MSNLIDVRSIEPDVMRGIKRRHCQQYQRACQGCPLFVENDSGLDCAAMIVETALAREHHDEVSHNGVFDVDSLDCIMHLLWRFGVWPDVLGRTS